MAKTKETVEQTISKAVKDGLVEMAGPAGRVVMKEKEALRAARAGTHKVASPGIDEDRTKKKAKS